jgi:hypothetical protein
MPPSKPAKIVTLTPKPVPLTVPTNALPVPATLHLVALKMMTN